MWHIKAKKCVLRIFTKDLPTYLGQRFTAYLQKGLVCRPSQKLKVYDIIEAGTRSRFTVMGRDHSMIVHNSIQSSGHQLLVITVKLFDDVMRERNIPYVPVIVDYHDESIVEVDEQHEEATKDAFKEVYRRLNEMLKATIKIKGDPDSGHCLAQFKVEHFEDDYDDALDALED